MLRFSRRTDNFFFLLVLSFAWLDSGQRIEGASFSQAGADSGPQDLASERRPGLVARYFDAQPMSQSVTRIDRVVAFRLEGEEGPHPKVDHHAWTARWTGQLQVHRTDSYRFSADLSGQLRVRVAGREVLNTTAQSADSVTGPSVELPAGELAIEIDFTKTRDHARLRLGWESDSFRREPIPWTALSHRLADEPPELQQTAAEDRGRLLVEEFSCVACHQAPDDRSAARLTKRQAPDLTRVGERIYAGWIYKWLESPQGVRPTAKMPRLFADDDRGRVERYAVARYLASRGGPLKKERDPNPNELRNWRRRGEHLFHRVGCTVCHSAPDGQTPHASISGTGSKTTAASLARFLQNPLAVDPSGRMPNMLLDGGEARDLAHFLCETKTPGFEHDLPPAPPDDLVQQALAVRESRAEQQEALQKLTPDQRLMALGERVVAAKGCANCHNMEAGTELVRAKASLPPIAAIRNSVALEQSCVGVGNRSASGAATRTDQPRFVLSVIDMQSVAAFLTSCGAGSAAPAFEAEMALERFNCVGCHSRRGIGGLRPDLIDFLRQFENAQDAEAIQPPPLTEVAAKLRPAWLRDVLVHGRRARPWMSLRMPQFGETNVGHLAAKLAAAEGIDPSDDTRELTFDPSRIEAGRRLVGQKGFGCISCHDIAGRPNYGTRGPDLASMHERIRYPWYKRWLEDSQRMQPGTRMPTVFPNGKSAVKTVFDGDGDAQSDAIWQYLSLGANLPLPEGLEPPRGLVITPNKPVVLRSFMPDAGTRALAIGFPDSIGFAFDGTQCRLAYGWTGGFLDATPVWTNRGGSPARVDGPRFWVAPAGFPWSFTPSPSALPRPWSEQQSDPRFGSPLPEGQLPTAPPLLQFLGYAKHDEHGAVFQYHIKAEPEGRAPAVAVHEHVSPRQQLAGVGLLRHFELRPDAATTAWLLVAQTDSVPEFLDHDGRSVATFSPDEQIVDRAASQLHLKIKQGSTATQLISVRSAPDEIHWVLRREGNDWLCMLRMPVADPTKLTLGIWSPYRSDAAMIQALLQTERRP